MVIAKEINLAQPVLLFFFFNIEILLKRNFKTALNSDLFMNNVLRFIQKICLYRPSLSNLNWLVSEFLLYSFRSDYNKHSINL